MAFLESFLPPQTSDFFFDSIFGNLNSGQTQGGVLSSVFLLSILLMANGVNAVFTGFETSYHEQLSRNFFKQYLYALGVALLLAFLLVITVAFWGYFEIYVIQNIHEQLELRGLPPQNRNYFGLKPVSTSFLYLSCMWLLLFFIIMVLQKVKPYAFSRLVLY